MKQIKALKDFSYGTDSLQSDLFSGLSVASIALPQNMAYALIAGVNPIYGLYTSIVSMIIATFVGDSDYMVVGPTNLMSMAIASNLSSVSSGGFSYLQIVILLTFMVGVFQLLFGLLRLGNLVNYISKPVITGLTAGAAILISVGQLENFLGLSLARSSNLFSEIYLIIQNINGLNLLALAMGLGTIVMIIWFEKIKPELPSYLISIFVSAILVYSLGLSSGLSIVGNVPASLPEFSLVNLDFGLGRRIFTKSLSVAIIGLIQCLAIVKSLETKSGQEVNINREFMGQGIINIGTSFFSGFTISGSFTNSYANYQTGNETRLSQFFTALSIILFILVFNSLIRNIPISSLSGLVIFVAYQMIDLDEIKEIFRAKRSDALIFLVTFITTLSAPRLEYAVYLGVLISLLVVIRQSSRVDIHHMIYDKNAQIKLHRKEPDERENDDYKIIDLSGDLDFSASDNLKEEFNKIYEDDGTFIIRMRNIERIDLTSLKELDKFIERVKESEGKVILTGISKELYEDLKQLNIKEKIGETNIYESKDQMLSSTIRAVETEEEFENTERYDERDWKPLPDEEKIDELKDNDKESDGEEN